MINTRFDIKRFNELKDILFLIHHGLSAESVRSDIEEYFKHANIVDILLIELDLLNRENGITTADILELSNIHPHLYNHSLTEEIIANTDYPNHPVNNMKKENIEFQSFLNQIRILFQSFENNPHYFKEIQEIKEQLSRLGKFHNHFHLKEKLFFPVMERYGYFEPTRAMWKKDDRIRALYKALNRQLNHFPDIGLKHILKTYEMFETEFKEMIFQEEAIILPVLQSIFHEKDWLQIIEESNAFGYAAVTDFENMTPQKVQTLEVSNSVMNDAKNTNSNENLRFGGGYLTTEEANLILNNLPLEITFVDKNSVFKYFNDMAEASEMMLVRTPISIGRNVSNCHPPKSLKKVMTLIRDLKTKKRTSESMWFKKKDHYIHLTYKALFNEEDEYLGILEYVQDIQPFFELPNEIKRGLSPIGESAE